MTPLALERDRSCRSNTKSILSVIKVKRVYDKAEASDGSRFLVDRLWPRGLKKTNLSLDGWLKELDPSASCATGLATIHEMERVPPSLVFRASRQRQEVGTDIERSRESNLTLVYVARALRAQQRCGAKKFF
jgi:uncharacterized protein YeaO (DUF488 family)